jgi:hypothetical protein
MNHTMQLFIAVAFTMTAASERVGAQTKAEAKAFIAEKATWKATTEGGTFSYSAKVTDEGELQVTFNNEDKKDHKWDYETHYAVRLGDLNPKRIEVVLFNEPRGYFSIRLYATDDNKAVKTHLKTATKNIDVATNMFEFTVQDERTARRVANALRTLIEEAGGKPDKFAE